VANFGSLKKITDKLLEIWFSNEDLRDDLEDCFDHLSKVCREGDEKVGHRLEQYLTNYSEQQELMLKGKEAKKKKGWF
jgi:hypothetical protein